MKSTKIKKQHSDSSRQKRRCNVSQHSLALARLPKKLKPTARHRKSEDRILSCIDSTVSSEHGDILGADIVRLMPRSVHFITGCAYFDVKDPKRSVGDNRHIRETMSAFFSEQLQKTAFVNGLYGSNGGVLYRVLGEIGGFLEKLKSTPLDRIGRGLPHSVCVWKQVNCSEGSDERRRLKGSTWESAHFRQVVSAHELKNVLQPPLKSSLKKFPIPPAQSNLA